MCILGTDTRDKPTAPCSGRLCFYTLPELFGLCWHFWKSAPVLWKMQTPFEKWHLHPSEHRKTERGREEMGIPTSAGVWHSPDFFQSANNSQSIFKISRCILNWPGLHSCSRLCCHTTDQSTGENPHLLLSDKQKRAHPWWTQTVFSVDVTKSCGGPEGKGARGHAHGTTPWDSRRPGRPSSHLDISYKHLARNIFGAKIKRSSKGEGDGRIKWKTREGKKSFSSTLESRAQTPQITCRRGHWVSHLQPPPGSIT